MYEHFTDRARKVCQLANQEAQRFNHEYLGTEHMLLALVKEGSGIAAGLLKALGMDLRKIRLEVEKLVQAGPDLVTMGRLPMTLRAKKVIEAAIAESKTRGDNHVGTEHLLLGLLHDPEAIACVVLNNLGVKAAGVRLALLELLPPRPTEQVVVAQADLRQAKAAACAPENIVGGQPFTLHGLFESLIANSTFSNITGTIHFSELKVGDVVRLKSGGPAMTVCGYGEPGNLASSIATPDMKMLRCKWIAADGTLGDAGFHRDALMLAPSGSIGPGTPWNNSSATTSFHQP